MDLSLSGLRSAIQQRLDAAPRTVGDCVDVFMRAYLEVAPTELLVEPDGDMLLFQWGTYDWGGGRWFEMDLTRQFIALDPDAPIRQLRLTMYFHPNAQSDELRSGNRWCHDRADMPEFRTWVRESTIFRAFHAEHAQRVVLELE